MCSKLLEMLLCLVIETPQLDYFITRFSHSFTPRGTRTKRAWEGERTETDRQTDRHSDKEREQGGGGANNGHMREANSIHASDSVIVHLTTPGARDIWYLRAYTAA